MIATLKVLGGLEITISFMMHSQDSAIEWEIIGIVGRTLRKGEKCNWLYRAIAEMKGEEDRILDFCYNELVKELES